jgi:ABC-type Fe3+-hydroxamate transport system substrate-binding protein
VARTRVRSLVPVLVALACAMLAAGCGFRKEPTTSGALQPVFPLTVQDADGRAVLVRALPRHVVTLDPGADRVLRSIGVQAQLLPASTRLDSLGSDKADLIVLPASTSTATAEALARRLKIPTFVFAGTHLQPIEHAALSLGIATGHAAQGEQVALKLRARREDLARRLAGLKRPKVFVDVVGLGVPPPPRSLIATLVDLAGGRLVGTGDVSTPVSAKRLRELDPDWYVTTRRTGLTLRLLRTRPKLAKLRSIRDGHFMIIDERLLQADDRAYSLLRTLARRLHPDAFQ